jgi:NADH:ubiquinone oxidoreductase subunit 6 (subunit J)
MGAENLATTGIHRYTDYAIPAHLLGIVLLHSIVHITIDNHIYKLI